MDSAGSRASGPGERSLVFVEFIAIINFDELHMVWRLRWVCEVHLWLLGRGLGWGWGTGGGDGGGWWESGSGSAERPL